MLVWTLCVNDDLVGRGTADVHSTGARGRLVLVRVNPFPGDAALTGVVCIRYKTHTYIYNYI